MINPDLLALYMYHKTCMEDMDRASLSSNKIEFYKRWKQIHLQFMNTIEKLIDKENLPDD